MMLDQCPYCQTINKTSSQHCLRCGHLFAKMPALVPERRPSVVRQALALIPAKRVGQVVAVSAVTLVAQIGASRLKRLVLNSLTKLPSKKRVPAVIKNQALARNSGATIVRRQLVQIWQNGKLTHELKAQEQIDVDLL